MKKVWVLVLLVSLGLNLGLGWRLLQNRGQCPSLILPGPNAEVSGKGWRTSVSDTSSWHKRAGRRLDRLARHLNLTSEQKAVFAKTRAEVGSRMMARRGNLQEARAYLLELVVDESTPQETLRHSFRELAVIQSEIDSVITEVLLQELEILDQDQRLLYLEMLPMNHRNHPGMHGTGRGRRASD